MRRRNGGTSRLPWLPAGAITAVLLPVLAITLNVAYPLAVVIALVAGAGALLVLAPKRPLDGVDATGIGRGKLAFASDLLVEAAPLLRDLQAAAGSLRDPSVRTRVEQLAIQAERIIAAVEQDPLKIDRAARFITYYLPRGVEMADFYRLLERVPQPDPARLQATADLLDRLGGAFAQYGDALFSADMTRLDLELRLLRASLDEDLGPVGQMSAAKQGA